MFEYYLQYYCTIRLTTQLEDTKRLGDGEAKDRAALLAKFKAMTTEVKIFVHDS